jgi:hypothetical protein
MRLPFLALVVLAFLLGTAPARADAVQTALNEAIAAFEQAEARLGSGAFGVDVDAYRDALTSGRFSSLHWGGDITLALEDGDGTAGCARFAAYVRLPPRGGTIWLVFCPQFSSQGTPALRRLTVLHEMVHVVAGADECRAMAFAARVEMLATGTFTPVERYWRNNDCAGSGFSLP